MGELKPYTKYKDSGVQWIGSIPEGWNVVRNKHFLKEFNVPSQNGDEDLLTVSQYTGITKRKDRLSAENDLLTTAKTLEGYKVVERGSLVMNIMLAWNGSLGLSDYDGIVSPAYAVFKVNKENVYPRYLHNLHRTKLYTGIFETASTGVIKSRLRLYPEKYLALNSVLPPLDEQLQIASFLDWKTSQINKYIKAKKRQIELLKEQKQVIINDAVTGKIDVRTGRPYPKYKDSGVEWLGMLPEDWRIFPIKGIAKSNLIALGEKTNPEYEFDYLEINKVKAGYLTGTPTHLRFADAPSRARRVVSYGDTIISTVRTYLRSVYYINSPDIKDLIVSTGFCVLTPKMNVFPIYLGYLLRSNFFIDKVIQNSIGVSYPAISDSKLMALKAPLPQFTEQEQIVKAIEKRTKNIDASIQNLITEITLLQEYRNSIIADVVTGKIDVRGIELDQIVEEGEESNFEEVEADQIVENETRED